MNLTTYDPMTEDCLKIYKTKLIDILAFFDEYCNIHALNYYACSGTALGAIRHNDIIPWDDDIDVFMPRKDYDIFIESIEDLPSSSKFHLKKLGDEDYFYPFAKLYDSETTLIELKQFSKCILGVYIDIFPLDEVSGSIEEVRIKSNEYKRLFARYQMTYLIPSFSLFIQLLYQRDFTTIARLFEKILCGEKKIRRIRDSFKSFEKSWSSEVGENLLCHHGSYRLEKEIMPKHFFESFSYVKFGRISIRVCDEYDQYLTHLFGDYMTPPPAEQQISHHNHYYLNLKEGLSRQELLRRLNLGESIIY